MPILKDFYETLGKDNKTIKYKKQLYPFVEGSLSFFNHHTNIEIENKLIIADIYELGEENLKYGMYIFTILFWDKIKKDRTVKKSIYLDEIWRLIGITSNKEVASFIYKIFKTIRKYSGTSVAITQDVSDLFSLENGTYGKSILNNSCIKAFFSLEEENIKVLSEYSNISEKEKIEITLSESLQGAALLKPLPDLSILLWFHLLLSLLQPPKHHIVSIASVIQRTVYPADRRSRGSRFFCNFQIGFSLPQHLGHFISLR